MQELDADFLDLIGTFCIVNQRLVRVDIDKYFNLIGTFCIVNFLINSIKIN